MLGLVNATTEIIEDIIWPAEASQSDLPLTVLVSCTTYNGPTLWHTDPHPGFPNGIPIIPITPLKMSFEINSQAMSWTQLPLQLTWTVTVYKLQGLTLKKIKLGLGKQEFSPGLTFVALSWVKGIDNIMLLDQVDYSRVQALGGKHMQYCLNDYACRYQINIR